MQREFEDGDVSEEEEEYLEEEVAEEPAKFRILKKILGSITKVKLDLYFYTGSMNTKELINQITDMDNFFEYEETDGEKKFKFVVTKLKGQATLWWDGVQGKRRRKKNQIIKS